MGSNLIRVNFQRQQNRTFTCHLYTAAKEKYLLVINAKNTTEAYHNAIIESAKHGVYTIRCVVFFSQAPDQITNDTTPLKVHLTPSQDELVNS